MWRTFYVVRRGYTSCEFDTLREAKAEAAREVFVILKSGKKVDFGQAVIEKRRERIF